VNSLLLSLFRLPLTLLKLPLLLIRFPLSMLRGIWAFVDDRLGISEIMQHPVPYEKGWRAWMYVFGSAVLFSFLLAVVTGIPIASIYIPSTAHAYASIQWLDNVAVLGVQLRGLHYVGGCAMLILVGLHMTRVFLTGAFKYPRELNWLTGVVLLLLTLGLMFTGQILRWDSMGLWTLSILTFIAARTPIIGQPLAYFFLGGPTFTGHSLSRIFSYHVFILPGLLFAFVGVHLYLVLKEGISESPRAGRIVDPSTYRQWYKDLLKREGVPFWPDAGWRDAVFGSFVVFAVIAAALLIGAPALSGPPNPTNVVVQPRPDWYFIWYYAAEALAPYGIDDYMQFAVPLIFFILMFAIPFIARRGERAATRRPWAVVSVSLAVLTIASLVETGVEAPWSPRFYLSNVPLPTSVTSGLSTTARQGAALWKSYSCQFCHVINGYGGIRGPDLSDVGNRLTAADMTIRILNGGYNMPPYAPVMSSHDLNAIVAFLQTRRQNIYPPRQRRQPLSLPNGSANLDRGAPSGQGAGPPGRAKGTGAGHAAH